ncbi:hypothetical protein Goari_004510, partial [Gossypium aridum]|nr:hypothetical protein [Gossypium aridum]
MSTERTFVEGSVTPPSSHILENQWVKLQAKQRELLEKEKLFL